MDNYEEKLYLKEIINLKEIIKIYDSEITSLKQNQINLFGKRYETLRSTGEFSIQNELIYSCLFGNGIV